MSRDMVEAVPAPFKTRANPDKMLAEYPGASGDGLINLYLAYECYRTRVNERLDLDGDTLEHLRIIDWYFTTYLQHRKHKLPLSAKQIAFLNTPLPVVDFARPVSMISHTFIRRELGQHWDLNDHRVVTEAIYWWCIERAPPMKLEGALVPNFYVDTLNEVNSTQRWLPFQLNYFAQRYYEVHSALHFLRLDRQADRVALLVYLVFQCGQEPHLVRFLPRDAIGRLLAPLAREPGHIVLDSIIAQLPSAGLAAGLDLDEAREPSKPSVKLTITSDETAIRLSGARIIRERLIERIEIGGYSLRSGRKLRGYSDHYAECYDGKPELAGPVYPGVALIGPLSATSGLGQASRMSLQVLESMTGNISLQNFDMDNPAPVGFSNETETRFPQAPRTVNLIHLNAESIPLAFAYQEQPIYKDSYNIGYFFWELTRIPACHHLALEMLDEIWVSSEYNREIYSRYTDIPVINVGMAVEPIESGLELTRAYFALPEDTFIFLATFDSFSFVERKNPLGVIRAFREAFPASRQDVALVLKTQNRFKVDDPYQKKVWAQIAHHCAADFRISVINETFSFAELLAFKQLCNCYVSLHRSEGWGFGMIEAMQLGIPVIATAYSGNMEFCNEQTCYLVEYELVGPQPHEYIFVERDSQWAEPRTASASAAMREVEQNRERALEIGAAGQLNVRTNFSVEAIAGRYAERLHEIGVMLGVDLFQEPEPEPEWDVQQEAEMEPEPEEGPADIVLMDEPEEAEPAEEVELEPAPKKRGRTKAAGAKRGRAKATADA
ncbi:glycosyltransferase family 4 protein [Acidisphaera sp. L21]|uniref:glycosyltransferase family 4 protein n=1 Tax=Acidisphaera sp. L21 TaxID=1641851 RepID=UPI00131D1818|nr:glycosyltransferase family 4 protein [Acidisphaera sp. L21]